MLKSKYFSGCKTKYELKQVYKCLLKQHHPDNGGDVAIMQEINAEYAVLSAILPEVSEGFSDAKSAKSADPEPGLSATLKAAIEKISAIPAITIEVCGKWVWVSGNTYPVRDALKNAGFRFSGKKKMWYFREETESQKYWKHKDVDMGAIRTKYGSSEIRSRSACLA